MRRLHYNKSVPKDPVRSLEQTVRPSRGPFAGDCIDELHLIDHGNVNVCHMGDDNLTDTEIKRICDLMCPGAKLKLWGCYNGNDKLMGRIMDLCDRVDEISGCSGTTRWPKPGWFGCSSTGPWCDGQWNTKKR